MLPIETRKAFIQSIVAFFAALVGFGLQKLLDGVLVENIDAKWLKWFYFMIVSALALRLFTGSTIHLFLEHADADRKAGLRDFLIDIAALFVYAVLLLKVSYEKSTDCFFFWLFITVFIALTWSLLRQCVPLSKQTSNAKYDWSFFSRNDLLHAIAIAICWVAYELCGGEGIISILGCFVLTLLVTYHDLRCQIELVDGIPASSQKEGTPITSPE